MDQPLLAKQPKYQNSLKSMSLFTYGYRYIFEPEILQNILKSFNERYLSLLDHKRINQDNLKNKELLKKLRCHLKDILIYEPIILNKTNKSDNFSELLGQSLAHIWLSHLNISQNNFSSVNYIQEPKGWILPMPKITDDMHTNESLLPPDQDIFELFKSINWIETIHTIERDINYKLCGITFKK